MTFLQINLLDHSRTSLDLFHLGGSSIRVLRPANHVPTEKIADVDAVLSGDRHVLVQYRHPRIVGLVPLAHGAFDGKFFSIAEPCGDFFRKFPDQFTIKRICVVHLCFEAEIAVQYILKLFLHKDFRFRRLVYQIVQYNSSLSEGFLYRKKAFLPLSKIILPRSGYVVSRQEYFWKQWVSKLESDKIRLSKGKKRLRIHFCRR